MTDFWFLLIFALFVVLIPALSGFVNTGGNDEELARSFAEQTVDVDGVSSPASELEVLYRAPTMQERYGCNTSWICRTPGGAYLLAMAQGELSKGTMVITWVWRRLTEERARQGMLHDKKAYRAAFPD